MKVLAIGDIHAKTIWKDIIDKESDKVDKIVFIGDYFDTFDDVSYPDQIENMNNILNLKRSNPNKYTILTGNHDIHYMKGYTEYCSGFNSRFKFIIDEMLTPAVEQNLMQMVDVIDDVVYSHAGVTKTWLSHRVESLDNINEYFKANPMLFKWNGYEPTGDDITQSPIWVRPNSLLQDRIDNNQVVGHTKFGKILSKDGIAFIDVLDSVNQYLLVTDGKYTVSNL